MRSKTDYRKLIGAAVAVLCLAACAPDWQTVVPPTATRTATETPKPGPTATVIITRTEGPTPSPEPAGDAWLLVNTGQGLYSVRPDGSDGAYRISGRLIVPLPLPEALSPADGLLAYLTTSDDSAPFGNYPGLTLNVISLLGVGAPAAIPLTSPATEPGDEYPSDILRAMTEQPDFAWSPEGGRLAFSGAQDGPSADLYEYYRAGGRIVRLTDGPDQAYAPHWSPDGRWIVHAAAAGFGTGAGISVTGMYAARADDGGVVKLYPLPEHSGGEDLVGWLGPHTAVTQSWFITCGPADLRAADPDVPLMSSIFQGCVSAAAVAPERGVVLFAQSPSTAPFDENPRPGLWIYASSGAGWTQKRLSGADIREIRWSEGSGAFLALSADRQILEIAPSGLIRVLAENRTRIPMVSPDGRYWADSGAGLSIGAYGREPERIFEGEVSPGQLIFSPAGDALFFLDAAGNLYRARAPEWRPVRLAEELIPASYELSLAWLEG
jgi:hypothetical protein